MKIKNHKFKLPLTPTGGAVWTGNILPCNVETIVLQPPVYYLNEMQNSLINLITRPTEVGILTPDVRNTLPYLSKISKTVKPVYCIEDAIIDGPIIAVDFILNDNWFTVEINLQALNQFIGTTGINSYCFDSSDYHGDHLQDSGSINIDYYLSENLNYAVKAYLEAGKVGQYAVN